MNERTPNIPRLLRYAGIALVFLVVLLLLFVNKNLADLVDYFLPGSLVWTHLGLLGVEAVAVFWFWRGVFGGHRHLLIPDSKDPEEKKRFAAELTKRLSDNPHVKAAGLAPGVSDDDVFLEKSLALLREKADAEIRENARRIFLATALSQNGKLDALIVFVSLCRLVWRVAALYNQRPHPREVVSLYGAVASSTFLALSIEELDIATEISVGFGESFNAMAPAGLTASIPFAGRLLNVFTASTMDGAANCYLALRAGIITRNAFAYGALAERSPSRAAVFREAGSQLLDMSQELVEKLAVSLASNLTGAARSAARYAGEKTVRAATGTLDVVQSAGETIVDAGSSTLSALGSSAGKLGQGTVSAVQSVGGTIGDVTTKTVMGTLDAAQTVGSAVGSMATGALGAVQSAGETIVDAGSSTLSALGNSAEKLGQGTVSAVQSVGGAIGDATVKVAEGTLDAAQTVGNAVGSAATGLAEGTGKAVRGAGEELSKAGGKVGKAAGATLSLLGRPFKALIP